MKPLKFIPKNKKGFEGIMFFVIALFVILMIGVIVSIAVGLIGFVSDTITPELNDLGVVGDTNLTQVASYTLTPATTFVDAMPWLIGFAYFVMLIFSMIFVISYESNPHPALMGAYFFFVVLIVLGAILISNIYEDIYTGTDDLATKLKEQTMLSYMILYSPGVLALISIVTGIIIFTRTGTGGSV